MHSKTKNLILLLFSLFSYAENLYIEVDISEQRLYVIENTLIKASYPVSTSKYGEGSLENSFKTPLGNHSIKEMFGKEAKLNTIFTSRINTQRSAVIIDQFMDTEDDYVTSRIIWLDGEEDGLNKGGNVDSYKRYIYIHGTHEEGLIGTKASHGCIRMFNYDVIELFNLVNIGTKVLIRS
jgi:lipoprotein-anchoring transpeptidase ErfK/SrfK